MDATRPRWKRRKDARPAEILDAALDVFAERGFAATRMDDVAARAGVTKGTVYLYFKTKEELFKALVRAELLPNLAAVEGAAGTEPAADLMGRLVHMWTDRVLPSRVGVLPKLMIAEAGNFPELAKFYLREVVHRGLALVRRVITRGVAAGEFRRVDVDQVAYLVIAPLLLTVLWKHSFNPHDDRPMDANALIRAHLDVLLNGLRNPIRRAAPGPRKVTRKRGER
jgi:AcrR family transcriptional regulator